MTRETTNQFRGSHSAFEQTSKRTALALYHAFLFDAGCKLQFRVTKKGTECVKISPMDPSSMAWREGALGFVLKNNRTKKLDISQME